MAKYVQSHKFSVLDAMPRLLHQNSLLSRKASLRRSLSIDSSPPLQGSQQKEVPASIGLDSKFPLRESETPTLGHGRCEGEQIPKLQYDFMKILDMEEYVEQSSKLLTVIPVKRLIITLYTARSYFA